MTQSYVHSVFHPKLPAPCNLQARVGDELARIGRLTQCAHAVVRLNVDDDLLLVLRLRQQQILVRFRLASHFFHRQAEIGDAAREILSYQDILCFEVTVREGNLSYRREKNKAEAVNRSSRARLAPTVGRIDR